MKQTNRMSSRTVKFRAWDSIQKKMSYCVSVYSEDDGMSWWSADHLGDGGVISSFENGEIMQYTGLKDKNGKEIYEGDILLSESWKSGSRKKRDSNIVEWGRCGWVASGYNGEIKVSPDLTVRPDFEVIGNIYENPELL